MKLFSSILKHLGIATLIIISAYTFLLKDVPFPFGVNRYSAWLLAIIISLVLILISVLLGIKQESNEALRKWRIVFMVIGISFTLTGIALLWKAVPLIVGSCFLLAAIGFFGCSYMTVQINNFQNRCP